MKKPNFFIVGAPRSGTTSLYEMLKQHPDIFMPKQKEPGYFDKDLKKHASLAKNKKQYLDLFSAARSSQLIGEASVWYLYSEVAAREIKKFNSDAKIIIMLRNPIEQMRSLHKHLLFNTRETVKDFTKAIKLEVLRRKNKKVPKTGIGNKKFLYTDIARYLPQVKRYIKKFGRNNVHIIVFRNFVNNPQKEYLKVLSFLEVKKFSPRVIHANAQKKYKNKILQHILMSSPTVVYKAARLLPMSLYHAVANFLLRLNSEKIKSNNLDRDFDVEIKQKFAKDIRELEKITNEDLSEWTLIKN